MKEQEIEAFVSGMNRGYAAALFTPEEVNALAEAIEAEDFAARIYAAIEAEDFSEANAMNDIAVLACGDAE